jgi:aminoglycoside N3'-acetyltransferase
MLGSGISREGSAYRAPAVLRRYCGNELLLIRRNIQGQRIVDDIKAIIETERFNSFDKFHETTKQLVDRYAKSGVITEVFEVPTKAADGKGRWVIHEAADVLRATVDILSPVKCRLIDYQQNPWHVAQWSGATPPGGLTSELVIIDSPEQLDKLPSGGLSRKIVLTCRPLHSLWVEAAKKGAAGIISDRPVHGQPDAVRWQKLGWGGIPFGTGAAPIVGLVLSENQGKELRKLYRQEGALTLHLDVDIRRYAGTHDVVSGIIQGSDDPQDEVWCLAHSGEPGAADNASGVAVCLEAARVLEELFASGRLPRPRRSIRFLNAYECYGFFYYLEHTERLKLPIAGINLDIVGLEPGLCNSHLYWHESIPMSAQFVNDVGQTILGSLLPEKKSPYRLKRAPFRSTADTLIGDPKYGFPCPWLTNCWRADDRIFNDNNDMMYDDYHTSNDTTEILSFEGLAVSTAAVAGYLYFLANAGNEEVTQLAAAETDHVLDVMLSSNVRPSAAQVLYWGEQHRQSMKHLQRWIWGGNRGEILKHLADYRYSFEKAAEALKKDGKDTSRDSSSQANASAAGPNIGAGLPKFRDGRRRAVLSKLMRPSNLLRAFKQKTEKAAFVPRRAAPFTPNLDNVCADMRKRIWEHPVRPWALYWADGNRSVAEITKILECEYRKDVSPESVTDYFNIHAELGYVELINPATIVTREKLVYDLRSLGLQPGMNVMVHSSLSRLGHVLGGADAVVDALLTAVGREGTLLMPSFNHRMARIYNPATTPTTNGAIADAMWRRPEAIRSIHGTHAVAAIGPKAGEWCKNHHQVGVWDQESPIGKIVHSEGYILCLGLTQNRITANHVAEMSIPCGCLDPFGNKDAVLLADGRVHELKGLAYRLEECPVPRIRLDQKSGRDLFRRAGKVGKAEAVLFKAIDLWNIRRAQVGNVCPSCRIKPNYK